MAKAPPGSNCLRNIHLAQSIKAALLTRSRAGHNVVRVLLHRQKSLEEHGTRVSRCWSGPEWLRAHLVRVDIAVRECHRVVLIVHNLAADSADNGRIDMMTEGYVLCQLCHLGRAGWAVNVPLWMLRVIVDWSRVRELRHGWVGRWWLEVMYRRRGGQRRDT